VNKACKTCNHFCGNKWPTKQEGYPGTNIGTCRKNPPKYKPELLMDGFPQIAIGYWCSEWTGKNENEEEK
jgi:hypothetical protein